MPDTLGGTHPVGGNGNKVDSVPEKTENPNSSEQTKPVPEIHDDRIDSEDNPVQEKAPSQPEHKVQ